MKYFVGASEGDYEPGSKGLVLKNMLNITTIEDIDDAENALLFKLYQYVFEPEFLIDALTFVTIATWHRKWLGNLYSWSGELRSVNMGKGGFEFAAAKYIPRLLTDFEKKFLDRYTMLENLTNDELVRFLAESHVEFILIHPFREGNGRISRLLMDVLATRAGFAPFDYSLLDNHKDFYFKSIQAGHSGQFQYMERLVRDLLAT